VHDALFLKQGDQTMDDLIRRHLLIQYTIALEIMTRGPGGMRTGDAIADETLDAAIAAVGEAIELLSVVRV
jgi:hypothetical protein